MKLKKYLNRTNRLFLSAITSLSIIVAWACADYSSFWTDNEAVFFSPNLTDTLNRNELFYFSRHYLNTGTGMFGLPNDLSPREADYNENVNDWFQYLSQKIDRRHIYHFLYQSAPLPVKYALQQKDFVKFYASDTLIAYLSRNKCKEALKYLFIAKKNEYRTDVLDDGWNYYPNYDVYGTDSINFHQTNSSIVMEIEQILSKKMQPFFVKRYAFQLLRYYRYNNEFGHVDKVFSKYWSQKENNFLYYEALNYECDAMRSLQQDEKANYYAAILFNEYPNKRLRSYQNFTRSIPVHYVLNLCLNDKEKGYVYTLYAFKDYYPNIRLIKKALTYNPNSDLIDILISREINKIDHMMMPEDFSSPFYIDSEKDNIFSQTVTDMNDSVTYRYPEKEEFNQTIIDLLKTLISAKVGNTTFYKIALAHVYTQQRNHIEAYNILMSIQHEHLTPKYKAQYALTSYLNFILSTDIGKSNNRNIALQKLNLIQSYQNQYYNYPFIEQGIRLILQHKLLLQNDYARAYLVGLSLSDQFSDYDILNNYARASDIDSIINIVKQPLSSFDVYVQALHNQKGIDIKELRKIQGSLYLREENILKAHICFKQTNDPYIPINFKTLNTNPDGHPFYPFYYKLPDSSELQYIDTNEFRSLVNRAIQHRLLWNNYSITREMLRLMLAIAKKEGNESENYFNLACLHFEITYHGRAYKAIDYLDEWTMSDMEYMEYRTKGRYYDVNYYGCKNAIQFYTKALENCKSKEIAARSLYALYRCVRYQSVYNNKTELIDNESNLKYLFLLHDQYANTEYYKIKECWGLSAYVDGLRN